MTTASTVTVSGLDKTGASRNPASSEGRGEAGDEGVKEGVREMELKLSPSSYSSGSSCSGVTGRGGVASVRGWISCETSPANRGCSGRGPSGTGEEGGVGG